MPLDLLQINPNEPKMAKKILIYSFQKEKKLLIDPN